MTIKPLSQIPYSTSTLFFTSHGAFLLNAPEARCLLSLKSQEKQKKCNLLFPKILLSAGPICARPDRCCRQSNAKGPGGWGGPGQPRGGGLACPRTPPEAGRRAQIDSRASKIEHHMFHGCLRQKLGQCQTQQLPVWLSWSRRWLHLMLPSTASVPLNFLASRAITTARHRSGEVAAAIIFTRYFPPTGTGNAVSVIIHLTTRLCHKACLEKCT